MFYDEINRSKYCRIQNGEKIFLQDLVYLFNEREKVLNDFKGNIFSVKVMGDESCEKIFIKTIKNTKKKTNPRYRF